jgi:hypothetical protein
MTSEVALMNRSAVALAADSAATVRHWERDHYENYYFKGTNKIFQLSAVHPVGIMIYATASLQGAPWEVLIKSYRDHLGTKAHDYLSGYAMDLFDYITNNSHVFSPDTQEKQFKADVDIVAMRLVTGIATHDNYKNAPDDATKKTIAATLLGAEQVKISAASFVGNAEQSDVDQSLAKFTGVIKDMLVNDKFYAQYLDLFDFEEVSKAAIEGQFKRDFTVLNSTGIVITGFGDKDFFPKLLAYRCYGLVLGKFIMAEDTRKSTEISQRNTSAFMSFAQDNMIQTFIWGTSTDILAGLEKRVDHTFDEVYQKLVKSGLAPDISSDEAKTAEYEKIKNEAVDNFGTEFLNYSFKEHSRPMRRVLGSLPLDELAELAHTLVLLESLKERVTSSSSSVSGPIDVAVISKNDGFIWIKRKHYFDPKLNPRYFANRGLRGEPT